MGQERRINTRVAAMFDARIIIDRQEIPVKTWNLSLRGMECATDRRFKEGKTCMVKFILSPMLNFNVQGKFVRVGKRETGIYFKTMDEDGFFHLKRLVQYNADDPDMIEDECAAPFHRQENW
jgi:hypothetical protein